MPHTFYIEDMKECKIEFYRATLSGNIFQWLSENFGIVGDKNERYVYLRERRDDLLGYTYICGVVIFSAEDATAFKLAWC